MISATILFKKVCKGLCISDQIHFVPLQLWIGDKSVTDQLLGYIAHVNP